MKTRIPLALTLSVVAFQAKADCLDHANLFAHKPETYANLINGCVRNTEADHAFNVSEPGKSALEALRAARPAAEPMRIDTINTSYATQHTAEETAKATDDAIYDADPGAVRREVGSITAQLRRQHRTWCKKVHRT